MSKREGALVALDRRSQVDCAPAQRPTIESFSSRDIPLVLLLLYTPTLLKGLGLSWGLIDGEPVVQAADALKFGETVLRVGVACERSTAAQASCFVAPSRTQQEPAVGPGVFALFARVLAVTEEGLLALDTASGKRRARGCGLRPKKIQKKM